MLIKILEDIKGEKYKQIINYLLENANIMSFDVLNIPPQGKQEFDNICKMLNENKNDLIIEYIKNNYNINSIVNRLYSKLKCLNEKQYKVNRNYIEAYVSAGLEVDIYYEKVTKILENLKIDLINIKVLPFGYHPGNRYYYKITPKIKEYLLSENNIFNFSFPQKPENICLYNDRILWLETITHEKMCSIYGNEKDANYIEKLGIHMHIK